MDNIQPKHDETTNSPNFQTCPLCNYKTLQNVFKNIKTEKPPASGTGLNLVGTINNKMKRLSHLESNFNP